jgi:hypothetical protein
MSPRMPVYHRFRSALRFPNGQRPNRRQPMLGYAPVVVYARRRTNEHTCEVEVVNTGFMGLFLLSKIEVVA